MRDRLFTIVNYMFFCMVILASIVITIIFKLNWLTLIACVSSICYIVFLSDRNLLNFIIGFIAFPFFTIFAGLLNALGDVGNVLNLTIYLLPALTILCITASIGLRRKLYGKTALAVQFISPALFAIIIIISYSLNLM